MNLKRLEAYAQQARREFNAAVTDRAALYGLTAECIEPMTEQGDVVLIGARPFSVDIAGPRERLADQISRGKFEQVMEAMAYTWFNRFIAIRFMELHNYLEHGFRVLSHPEDQDLPEILEQAADVELTGLDRERVLELKLDGTKDEELYRLLLMAQCNALHTSMPFLFNHIGDITELLLPASLLHTDSLIRKLTRDIDESEWEHIEIIGWLYQFYISEKKEQVIGKVVASHDIPAATQLFTPNWIVKYLVQNSLGAQWLATYPRSRIREQMDFYIEPAAQTEEVAAQLEAITPGTLDPETLTLFDPACGSGHILVEAYDLFKEIYLERGYRAHEVAQLILENNLFGLDIDERAAQLTGFSLMMKGRADDRHLFGRHVKLNVLPMVNSTSFDADPLVQDMTLSDFGLRPRDLTELVQIFAQATTFGSLIQVPEGLAAKLAALKKLSYTSSHDFFVTDALNRLGPLVQQAEMLTMRYHLVVANPPYMGSKFHIPALKRFLNDNFLKAKNDLFACFIERSLAFTKPHGYLGFMSPFVWMFISSHQGLRQRLLNKENITSLIQLEYSGFAGATVPICTFTMRRNRVSGRKGCYIRLSDFKGSENQSPKTLEAIRNRDCGWFHEASQDEFKHIPGSPVAYWISANFRRIFEKGTLLGNLVDARVGLQTGNTSRFLRRWHEVDRKKCGFGMESRDAASNSGKKWFPYNKGGEFRKWYGNLEYVVNWEFDGREIRAFGTQDGGRQRSRPQNVEFYFQASLTWSDVTSGPLSFRLNESGTIHDVVAMSAFGFRNVGSSILAGYCNSPIVNAISSVTNPTLHFHTGNFADIPFLREAGEQLTPIIASNVERLVKISRSDWNSYERSWEFDSLQILSLGPTDSTIESNFLEHVANNRNLIAETKRLEEENNRLFIDAYGLADELTHEVPVDQITLTVNPAYRYGGELTEDEKWSRFRSDTMAELVSYAIGCMMGRYSLDEPGLIYAHSGNVGFDPNRYSSFPADEDGIVPLTEYDWFNDDAAQRLINFISVAWNSAQIEDNLTFLADSLEARSGESSRETLRHYLCDKFFKDHLQTYKKRPIYWLFSSGKLRSFQCLVYLHRYNAGTLARMRTEYVIPLQGMMASRVRQLEGDIEAAPSNSHRKRLEKERGVLAGQRLELQAFDEKLRHFADQRISLNIDDGVKVNYGKFDDLLAEVKTVTGIKTI